MYLIIFRHKLTIIIVTIVTLLAPDTNNFVDEENAYLMGSKWTDSDPELLYATEDGGLSWSAVSGSNASILRGIVTIEFHDKQTGWAGGAVVMKTTDGGQTWAVQMEIATIREFFVHDDMSVIGVGKGSILRTIDGGANWTDVAPVDERVVDLRAVHFVDASNGWIAGSGRELMIEGRSVNYTVVLVTTDGGETWFPLGTRTRMPKRMGNTKPWCGAAGARTRPPKTEAITGCIPSNPRMAPIMRWGPSLSF